MAYLLNFGPDYEQDIFVSYAHDPLIGNWLDDFADDLIKQVGDSLVERRSTHRVSLWRDSELEGNLRLDPQLSDKVKKSALLMVIMSKFYLESEWCTKEARWFEEARGGWTKTDGRIFVIKTHDTNLDLWPKFLRGVPGYAFYKEKMTMGWPRPTVNPDPDYWKALPTLAEAIAKQLKLIAEQSRPADPAPVPPPGRPTVFLAVATEDVGNTRREVRNLLAPSLNVVPFEDAVVPERVPGLLAQHLPSCDAFIQIVGAWLGMDDYVQFQHAEASRSGKPLFVWRCPNPAFESKDDAFKRFLAGLKLSAAADAEAFVTEVKGTFESVVPVRRKVFVEAVAEDQELRRQLRQLLLHQGLRVLPFRDMPTSVRSVRDISATDKAWVDEMLRCDAIVYLNGSGPDKWLERAMLDLWDITSRRSGDVKRVAVIDKPAEPPLEPFDPEIPVFRFNCPDFLHSFTRWINLDQAVA